MATKRVYVYKNPGFIDSYKVFPPVIVIEQNDKFELVNTVDDHDAFLSIPDGTFQGGSIKEEKVPKKSKSGPKTPNAGPPERRIGATGASEPRVQAARARRSAGEEPDSPRERRDDL